MARKEDIKTGYILCAESIREQIDEMINEVHRAYMNNTDEKAKERLDAQMKILWNIIFMLEDTIVDCDKMFEDINKKEVKDTSINQKKMVEKYPKDFMDVLICTGIERTAHSLICRYCAKDCEEVDYETCFKFREKRDRR